jgi:hypothetical protein
MLNWTERIIRMRKEVPEIGWGDFTVLNVRDPAVIPTCQSVLVPRHFGNLGQPQNRLPTFEPFFASLITISAPQRGQSGVR